MLQRRRERINERLKILQKLVPNGTKVIDHLLICAMYYIVAISIPFFFLKKMTLEFF